MTLDRPRWNLVGASFGARMYVHVAGDCGPVLSVRLCSLGQPVGVGRDVVLGRNVLGIEAAFSGDEDLESMVCSMPRRVSGFVGQ